MVIYNKVFRSLGVIVHFVCRKLVEKSFQKSAHNHLLRVRNGLLVGFLARLCSVATQLLQELLDGNDLDQNLVMELFAFVTDGPVLFRVLALVLFAGDHGEVNFFHQSVKLTLAA